MITCLISVVNPNDPTDIFIWSASATEITIVVINPKVFSPFLFSNLKTREIVEHIALDQDIRINYMVQSGPYVWIACYRKILVFDAKTAKPYRILTCCNFLVCLSHFQAKENFLLQFLLKIECGCRLAIRFSCMIL